MAVLSIDLRRPTGAFLFDLTTPKLLIDGIDHQVPGWGRAAFEVPAGPHRVEVYVPYVLPRRAGKATLDLTVGEQGAALEYMAPTISFAKGSLGAAGQQRSSGFRTVWAFNILTVVLVVAAVVLQRLF